MIPGVLVALATFPGVIVHEAAHMLFCRLRGIAVLNVCFFRLGNPVGYVIHEETDNFTSAFLIAVGPFIVNSLLCVVLCFPAFVPVRMFHHMDPLSLFLIWIGVSIGMHAFPSTQDGNILWRAALRKVRGLDPLALLSFPVVILIYAARILSVFWFDCFYGLALGFLLPEFILNRLV